MAPQKNLVMAGSAHWKISLPLGEGAPVKVALRAGN